MPSVARISIAPVKGLGLLHPAETQLTLRGAEGDRRFHLVDASGRLVNGKQLGALMGVRPRYDEQAGTLELSFPEGSTAVGEIALGDPVETSFYGRPVRGRLVAGPWSVALSAFAGEPLRLARSDDEGDAIDRTLRVSLVSDGSLVELGRQAGGAVDGRRFRMTFELSGCRPHEEDEWLGRRVRVGDAVVVPREPVGRCAVTTLDPETGARDLDTLRLISGYRGLRDGESIDFGVCGEIARPGRVRVGDPVELLEP